MRYDVTQKAQIYEYHRKRCAYGIWTTSDGEKVPFNRDYEALGENNVGRWVENIIQGKTIYFYDDDSAPWLSKKNSNEYHKKMNDYDQQYYPEYGGIYLT